MGAWLSLPFGLLMLWISGRLAAAVDPRKGAAELLLPLMFFGAASAGLAVGLWAAVEPLEDAALRPGSRLRPLAGTGRAFLRPALAAALLAAAAWSVRADWRDSSWAALLLVPCALPLLISAWLCFDGVPSMLATWRAVGGMALTLHTARARPGEALGASLRLNRKPDGLQAALRRYDAESKAQDHLAESIPAALTFTPDEEGWTASVAARVPEDARPSLPGGEDWRYWELEVWLESGGRRISRSQTVEVEG